MTRTDKMIDRWIKWIETERGGNICLSVFITLVVAVSGTAGYYLRKFQQ